jgi:hypothetical protein
VFNVTSSDIPEEAESLVTRRDGLKSGADQFGRPSARKSLDQRQQPSGLYSVSDDVSVVLWLGFTALAQGQRGMRNYNLKTETTVKGTIENVQLEAGTNGGQGTHLLLKTDSGTLPVHVGPSAYIAKKQFSFSKGDEIKVLGSKVSVGGKGTLLAREITKGGKTLVLRDAQGIPEWAGTRGQN